AVLSADVTGLDPSATQALQVQAFDAAGNVSADGPTASLHIGTPSPGLVAPPIDTSVAATVLDAFSFLFTGENPIQTGANAAVFDRQRACLVRGQVSDATGAPLQDVTIGTLNHSEFGTTRTHLDGTFDLVVNGGGDLVLTYSKPGYTTAQRHIAPRWNSSVSPPDVMLMQLDRNVTEIESDFSTMQVSHGSPVSDADGPRQR